MFLAHNVEALFSSDSARAGHLETFVHQIINIRHPHPWHSPPGNPSRSKTLYSYTNRMDIDPDGVRRYSTTTTQPVRTLTRFSSTSVGRQSFRRGTTSCAFIYRTFPYLLLAAY